jgi:FkbM family methyltransferase
MAFVDNSAELHGSVVDGITVLTPADAVDRYGDTATFVVTTWSPSRPHVIDLMSRQIVNLGARRVVPFVPLFWKYPDEFLPYYGIDLPHHLYEHGDDVRRAYALFRDPQSRGEFLHQVSYLLSLMDSVDVPRGGTATYFPPDLLALSGTEVFVDCGAYDGDTLDSFLQVSGGRFRAVVAFEPDPLAVVQLRKRADGLPTGMRDRIRIEQKAVASSPGLLRFAGDGTPGSRISQGGAVTVESVTLDGALWEAEPTYIKMDIEGAEEGALLGAAAVIREHRPVLAICVYHLQADIYRLPILLNELCSDYRLFLRRQGPDGDLVCYAIPTERLRH